MTMLDVDNVHTYYGNIHALKGISITVEEGEIVTLIGGNGAGKSTTLKTISGLMRPREGHVRLNGEDLSAYKAHQIVGKGIVQVPEGRQVFGALTVMENLRTGLDRPSVTEGRRQELLDKVCPGCASPCFVNAAAMKQVFPISSSRSSSAAKRSSLAGTDPERCAGSPASSPVTRAARSTPRSSGSWWQSSITAARTGSVTGCRPTAWPRSATPVSASST